MWFRALVAIVLLVAAAACDKKAPPTPSPGPDGVETIRGTERLGWDQRALDAAELATFRYAIYVDGARSEIADTSCGATAGANGFACSGRLPAMAPGQHTIELATFTLDGGSTLESPRSTALRVTVTASGANLSAQPLRPGDAGVTSDGVRLQLDVLVEGLDDVTDIASDPDGRLFIAERSGRFRIVDQRGREQSASDVAGGLVAFALDTDFARTRFVFVAQAPRDPADGREAFTIARYREVNGTLGERMVLLHGVTARADRASAALDIGPDGKLYVALDDGGDARLAADASSLNGKLLRLNRDGTTPDDQAAGAPVQGAGYRSPRAIAFDATSMWIADGAPRVPERLNAVVATSVRPRRLGVRASYALEQNTGPSDALVYRADLFGTFRGNLFVAADDGNHILRVRFDPRSPTRIIATEKLLDGVGPIRALAVAPDGSIYFATPASIGRLSPIAR